MQTSNFRKKGFLKLIESFKKSCPSGVGADSDADPNVFGGFGFGFTMRRAHVFPGLGIMASTGDPKVTLKGALRIDDSVCVSTVIVTGKILDPFPQIPMDIIKSKGNGQFCFDPFGTCSIENLFVTGVPGIILRIGIFGERPGGGGSCTGCVFPFDTGAEAVGFGSF